MKEAMREIWLTWKRTMARVPASSRRVFVLAVAIMAVTGALASVPALLIGRLVDDMLAKEYHSFILALPYLAVVVVAVVLKEGMTVCRKWLVEDNCTRVQKAESISLINHLLHVDLGMFARHQSGSLNGRIHRSVGGMMRMLKLSFLEFFPSLFAATCAFVVAAIKAPLVGFVMAIGVAMGLLIILKQVASQRGIRVGLLRDRECMDGAVVETLGGIETVRAMDTSRFEVAKVEKVAERLRAKEIRHHVLMAMYDACKFLSEGGFHVVVLSISVWLAVSGKISVGEVLTFSMLYVNVAAPLRELHRIIDEAHESSLQAQDLFAMLDHAEDASFKAVGPRPTCNAHGGGAPLIMLRDVRFSYPGSNGSGPAINGVTLDIGRGERIGVVGRTGCGKSSLVRLILRLFEPDWGEIVIDGRPLAQWSRADIAESIGYVSQNPFLFSGTILENIAYGMPDATEAAVVEAARRAHIHDEIARELGGYGAQVAERGSNLSGGQRQRLAIARLFLKNPSVVILDEATAALDNRTEASVQAALDAITANRTLIAVAHRLNTVERMDRIIVMDQGRIVEEGTYGDLMTRGGPFSHLASSYRDASLVSECPAHGTSGS